jgi:hypothetical protein|mmetsp:Transcript_121726/g.191009  ORF Transcript_121726/g.191009 Transcript_121726/m.191009 type:complete len:318 (-) Transcript_121726:519-1472(-)
MDSNMASVSTVCQDDFLMQMCAWQFPSDVEAVFDDSTESEGDNCFNLCDTAIGADECQSAGLHELSFHRQSTFFDMRASDVVKSATIDFLEAPSDVVLTPRPFQSLALPEWVHEKDADDEAAGIFKRSALASFSPSPTSSKSGSPLSSRSSSPEVPLKENFNSRPVASNTRRSTVSWADLAESDDNDFDCIWSASSSASTAASSPVAMGCSPNVLCFDIERNLVLDQACQAIVPTATALEQSAIPENANSSNFFLAESGNPSLLVTASAAANIPQNDNGQHADAHTTKASQKKTPKTRWVDLVDSDVDPLDYVWSFS